MAADEQQGSANEHRGTLAATVEEVAQEGRDGGGTDGEPAEDVGSGLGRDAVEVALQHVGAVALEGEDGRIVEHAEQGHNPEDLAGENLHDVGELELVLSIVLLGLGAQLAVEAAVEDGEHGERDQTDEQQHRAEAHGGHHSAHLGGYDGRDAEDGEHAHAGYGHLQAHGQGHLLALEPLGYGLRHRRAGHLTAAAEYHEAQRGHLGAGGQRRPPGVEPGGHLRRLEPVGDAHVLDAGAGEHHAGREHAGEAYAHLVQDETGQDEESEHVQYVLRCGIGAEDVGCPSALALHQGLYGRHHIHKHVAKEHRRGYQYQHSPAHPGAVVHLLLNRF